MRNHLLAALTPANYAQLQTRLEPVDLKLAENLQISGATPQYVYFPTGAVIVLHCQVDRRQPFAVALVGLDGLVGLPVFLGASTTHWGAQVHCAGTAWRLSAAALRQICRKEEPLSRHLRRYTDELLTQVIRAAACGRFHLLLARLARLLLMTGDRSRVDTFYLTHEAMAGFLGVRREAVTHAAGELRRQKLIVFRRGLLQILDRDGLERVSCNCYQRLEAPAPDRS